MLLLCGCSKQSEQNGVSTGLMNGQIAPDFTLKDLSGNMVSLSAFRNKNAVCLTFWATWCPHCLTEIPKIKTLHENYSKKGLKVIAVNVGSNDPLKKVQAVQTRYNIPYSILYDEQGYVSRLYGVQGIPVSIIIDRKGIIQYKGYQLPEDINKLLDQVL